MYGLLHKCQVCMGSVLFDQNNKGLRIERHVERSYEGGKHVCNIRGVGGGGCRVGNGIVLYRPFTPPNTSK